MSLGGRFDPPREWGNTVIVEAFLKWSETARVADRAKAANALARAYLRSSMGTEEKRAAQMAMTYLLDDPSPKVRLALAEALATAPDVPRALILSLAEDQAEISATVIMNSPVMTDDDFIELAGRGDSFRRSLIAARPQVSRLVSAAIAAIGDEPEIVILLENRDKEFAGATLRDIARRHGKSTEVRSLLLERDDLPADVRHLLMQEVSEALSSHHLIRAIIGEGRAARIAREANEIGTLMIAGRAEEADIPALVEHLRAGCRLTPAFLMHALCAGRVDFIASVLVNLTGIEDRRVRAVLSTSRMHAVRALFEAAGLHRSISTVFVEATLLLRRAAQTAGTPELSIAAQLLQRFRSGNGTRSAASDLMDQVEKLVIAEQRQLARSYAVETVLAA